MGLWKRNKSYISLLINEKKASWFCFEKKGQRYLLKAVAEIRPEDIGFIENRLINSSFFAEWIYDLLELYSIKRPALAINCLIDEAALFQYQLFFYQLDLPLYFIGSVKRNKSLVMLVDNELEITVSKADLFGAISLWGDVDENGT